MKTNAIIRIILFSLMILLLLGLLAAGLGIGIYMFDVGTSTQDYISGSGSVFADEINNLHIEWASGSVSIQTADVDTISFTETATGNNIPEMVYAEHNGTLTIQFGKPALQIGLFSFVEKDLTITVPTDWECKQLDIEAASADVSVNSLLANKAELDIASGDTKFIDCDLEQLEIDSASGDVQYIGYLTSLECDAASADVTAVLYNTPTSISMDSASGDMTLTLPADSGFTASVDSMRGDFRSEFSTVFDGKTYLCGDGACRIELDCASGDIQLYKGE